MDRKEDHMAELKTKPTTMSFDSFLKSIEDPARRKDCITLAALMKKITGCEPKMWGTTMVGFGDLHYKYASGHEGDTFILGFANRKAALTLYACDALDQVEQLKALGKHKAGKGCLYIKSLADVDMAVLTALLTKASKRRS